MESFLVTSIKELAPVAGRLIEFATDIKVIAFYGEMGAGKTTFIKEICSLLGVKDTVNSPTYTIVNEYEGKAGKIVHFDFYRLKNAQEAKDIGCEDYFYSGNYCFIEWPERIENLLPEKVIKVTIKENKGQRTLIFEK